MKIRIRFIFFVLALMCSLCGLVSCAKEKQIQPELPYPQLWEALSKEMNLSELPSDFDQQVSAITGSQEYSKLLTEIEDKASKNFQRSQCGQIVGISDFSKPLRAFDVALKKTTTSPGAAYFIKFRPRNSDGSVSNNAWVGVITKPDSGKNLPLVIWAHESFGEYGADKVGYNSLINRLNVIQAKGITALPIYPGECLIEKDGQVVGCSSNDEKKHITYDLDLEAILTLSDCMRTLNEQSHVSWLGADKEPTSEVRSNPFHGTIASDPNFGIKQILTGFSYGGATALLTAARAGTYIKLYESGKVPHTFHPHYFHGIGAFAPFGSTLTGNRVSLLKPIIADKNFNLTPQNFYAYGFISQSVPESLRQISTDLPPLKLAIAEREALFFSNYLPYSLKSKFSTHSKDSCNLSVFYSKEDHFSNYPSINKIIGSKLHKDCKNSSVSFYAFDSSNPHNLWLDGKVIEHEFNGTVDLASPALGQSLYPLEIEWFEHLNR
jgi:hypothetical protein